MEPIIPLSIKFEPPIREQVRQISGLLNWSENQFVNDCVGIVLGLIADRSVSPIHKTIFLAQQALDFNQPEFRLPTTTSALPSKSPRKRGA